MRFLSWRLGAFAALSAGAFFAACSESVTTNPAGNSSSSSSGSTSSSGGGSTMGMAGMGGMGGVGGMANMGGMGGASSSQLCNDACDHAAACGIPVCSFIGVNCNSGMDYTCPSQCLLDANCAQINTLPAFPNGSDPALTACLSGCQGGSGGSGGGGVGDCTTCGFMNCQAEGGACNADTAPMGCQAWFQCVQGCTDAACVADCDMMNPNATPESTNLRNCLCGNCSAECGTIGACGQGGMGGQGGN